MDENKNITAAGSETESSGIKDFLNRKSSKRGLYAAAISAIVIVLVIVVNLIIGQLPSNAIELDISGAHIYSVSSVSKEFLKELKDDIEIVVIAQEGAIDERISKFIDAYAAESSHITVTRIDPVLHPSALENYGAGENDVVVLNKTNGKQQNVQVNGFSGGDSAMILYDYQTYAYQGTLQAVSLDADSQLTSAINIITGDNAGTIYTVTNHGETSLPATITDRISKLNIDVNELDILMTGSIPEDCDLLILNNPANDMTEDELSMLSNYLKEGGKAILLIESDTFTNFNTLLAKYGLQLQAGYVGDETRFYQTFAQQYGYFCIAPVLSTSSSITKNISGNSLFLFPHGMLQITPERRSSTVEVFMQTSDTGMAIVDEENQTLNTTFILGAVATEGFDDNSDGTAERTSRLTVISGANFLEESLLTSMASITNADVFMNCITENFDGITAFNIPSRSLQLTYNTLSGTTLWGIIFIAIIPIGAIVGGIVYWSKRRKR